MRSEQQHIDDFFRKKEEEYQQDTGLADVHWEQMRGLLKPAPIPAPKGFKLLATRRIIKYLGGFTVVTVITLVAITTLKPKKKAPATKALAQKTVTASPQKQAAATLRDTTAKPVTPTRARAILPAAASAKAATYRPATAPKKMAPAPTIRPAQPARPYQSEPIRKTPTRPVTIQQRQPEPATPVLTFTKAMDQPAPAAIDFTASTVQVSSAAAIRQLNAFYKELEKPGTQFVIPVNKDTILIGPQGTRLNIPAAAFANKKGVPLPNGTVKIVLREYYTYADILAAKLSTTSGGTPLVSGGMVHLQAEAFGAPVKIAAGKSIQLDMPTKQVDEQMQLFRGVRSSLKNAVVAKFMDNRMIDTVHFIKREADENGEIDWVAEGQEQKRMDPLNYRVKVLDLYDDPYNVIRGRKVKAWFYVAKTCPYSNEEMKMRLRAKYNNYYDEVKIRRVNVVPVAQYNYGQEVVPIAGDSVYMTFRQALHKELLSPEDNLRILERIRAEQRDFAHREALMNQYSFTITNLGWFNCDKYNNGPTIPFTFTPGEGYDPTTIVSHLVFNRFKTVMPGTYKDNKIQFGKVPRNEEVKVVCIGIRNGKVMACIQSLNTDKNEIGQLAFEETTPEKFRQKLQELNLLLP